MTIFSKKLALLAKWSGSIRWCTGLNKMPGYPSTVVECDPYMLDRGIYAVDPCEAHKAFPAPRVIIVGAGMAGLSAAARLTQRGITNFLVLEAYERPGGRIRSCFIGDVVAELGASSTAPNCTNHPVYDISAREDPAQPGPPATVNTRGMFNRVVPGKMEFPPTIMAYHKFRQIEKEANALYCLGGSKQQGSLMNFFSLRITQELHDFPEEHQHDAARVMYGLAHILSARCGDDTHMLCTDHCGYFMNLPGAEARVPLGQAGSVAPMLQNIPEGLIRYCKPVNCIYWGTSHKEGHRAIVTTTDGDEYPCDYVILTVSLGVLHARHSRMFCPGLPATKIDAVRCLGFGYCNKIYLEYCRPFWFWHMGSLNFKFPCSGCCSCCCGCGSDWTQGVTSIELVPFSHHVLQAWVIGPHALTMELLCERDIAEGMTCLLRNCTGNPCIPYPMSILRSHWVSDPYFLGAYSYSGNCSDGTCQRALASPLPGPSEPIPPILLFAGEATVPGHFATVAGARLSGVREAERVVQLTLQFKGPPLPGKDYKNENEKEKGKKKRKKAAD